MADRWLEPKKNPKIPEVRKMSFQEYLARKKTTEQTGTSSGDRQEPTGDPSGDKQQQAGASLEREQQKTGTSSGDKEKQTAAGDEQGPASKKARIEDREFYSQHSVYEEPCEQYQRELDKGQITGDHLDRLRVESYVVGGWSLREARPIPKTLQDLHSSVIETYKAEPDSLGTMKQLQRATVEVVKFALAKVGAKDFREKNNPFVERIKNSEGDRQEIERFHLYQTKLNLDKEEIGDIQKSLEEMQKANTSDKEARMLSLAKRSINLVQAISDACHLVRKDYFQCSPKEINQPRLLTDQLAQEGQVNYHLGVAFKDNVDEAIRNYNDLKKQDESLPEAQRVQKLSIIIEKLEYIHQYCSMLMATEKPGLDQTAREAIIQKYIEDRRPREDQARMEETGLAQSPSPADVSMGEGSSSDEQAASDDDVFMIERSHSPRNKGKGKALATEPPGDFSKVQPEEASSDSEPLAKRRAEQKKYDAELAREMQEQEEEYSSEEEHDASSSESSDSDGQPLAAGRRQAKKIQEGEEEYSSEEEHDESISDSSDSDQPLTAAARKRRARKMQEGEGEHSSEQEHDESISDSSDSDDHTALFEADIQEKKIDRQKIKELDEIEILRTKREIMQRKIKMYERIKKYDDNAKEFFKHFIRAEIRGIYKTLVEHVKDIYQSYSILNENTAKDAALLEKRNYCEEYGIDDTTELPGTKAGRTKVRLAFDALIQYQNDVLEKVKAYRSKDIEKDIKLNFNRFVRQIEWKSKSEEFFMKCNLDAFYIDTRAKELGLELFEEHKQLTKHALTDISLATMEGADGTIMTAIAVNEGSYTQSVKNSIEKRKRPHEEWVWFNDEEGTASSKGNKRKRHAEDVLLDGAIARNLKIKPLGSSHTICGDCWKRFLDNPETITPEAVGQRQPDELRKWKRPSGFGMREPRWQIGSAKPKRSKQLEGRRTKQLAESDEPSVRGLLRDLPKWIDPVKDLPKMQKAVQKGIGELLRDTFGDAYKDFAINVESLSNNVYIFKDVRDNKIEGTNQLTDSLIKTMNSVSHSTEGLISAEYVLKDTKDVITDEVNKKGLSELWLGKRDFHKYKEHVIPQSGDSVQWYWQPPLYVLQKDGEDTLYVCSSLQLFRKKHEIGGGHNALYKGEKKDGWQLIMKGEEKDGLLVIKPIEGKSEEAIEPPEPVPTERAKAIPEEPKKRGEYQPKKNELANDFALMHGVNYSTFYRHMTIGIGKTKVAYSERDKPGRKKERERYLTPEQQKAARNFWTENNVKFHEPEQQEPEQKARREYQPEGLPEGSVLATAFARDHGVNYTTLYRHMTIGLGPGQGIKADESKKEKIDYSGRSRPGHKKGQELYLDREQQEAALDFWSRHNVKFQKPEQQEPEQGEGSIR